MQSFSTRIATTSSKAHRFSGSQPNLSWPPNAKSDSPRQPCTGPPAETKQIPRPRVPHARMPQLRHPGRYAHMSYTSLHTYGPVRHTRAASPSCTVPPAADGAHAASSPSGPARRGQDGLSSVPMPSDHDRTAV